MNNIVDLTVYDRHVRKYVEIKLDCYRFSLWVTNDNGQTHGLNVDEEILDMIVNVIFEFKEKLAEARGRIKHVA